MNTNQEAVLQMLLNRNCKLVNLGSGYQLWWRETPQKDLSQAEGDELVTRELVKPLSDGKYTISKKGVRWLEYDD